MKIERLGTVIGRFESSIGWIADSAHTRNTRLSIINIGEKLESTEAHRFEWVKCLLNISANARIRVVGTWPHCIPADDRCELHSHLTPIIIRVQRLYYNVSVALKLWHCELILNLMTL